MDENTYDFSVTDGDYTGSNQNYDFSPSDFSYGDTGFTNFADWNNEFGFNNQQQPMDFSGQSGDQSYAPGSMQYNLTNAINPGMSMPQTTTIPDTTGWGAAGGGISGTLEKLFSNSKAIKGLAALMEGGQNKRYASNLQNMVNQNRQMLDPFGSQRGFYQGQLQSAVQNPYQAAIVRDQVNQIAQAQARKDAAAGRRSNMATTSPAMLAAQAAVAQNYMNSLMQPAGAGIAPQGGAALQALMPGAMANAQGYTSPIVNAMQNYATQQQLANLFGK